MTDQDLVDSRAVKVDDFKLVSLPLGALAPSRDAPHE